MELKFTLKRNFGNFSLNVGYTASDRTGIFGPSGSGKSTIVSLLAGLEQPDSGYISLDNEILFDSAGRVNIPSEQRMIGVVFQYPHLFPHLSVKNNLLYGFKRCAPDRRKIKLDDIVNVLQIQNLLNRGVTNLSGGEKQRVAIGRAVLSNPKLLLLDEPLSSLDDRLKFNIIPFLKKTSEIFNIPYIFITHSILEMRIMTDNVLTISNGQVTGSGTAEELAIRKMKESAGYANLLRLIDPQKTDGHFVYRWGKQKLFVANGSLEPESMFEFLSTDIILFRRRPDAVSARNILKCKVKNIIESEFRIGVKLDCDGEKLVAEIVREAADELGIRKGGMIYAAMKAVAFKRLW